jgi:hypothetical protein
MQPLVLTLAPINIESVATPLERSFTNYRRAGLLLPLTSSTRQFSPKSPRNSLSSLLDRYLVCYLVRVAVTIPESSFQGHFPLFRNCRGMRPWVCFYYLLLAFIQRPAGPRIHPIATPLAGPNLLILKTVLPPPIWGAPCVRNMVSAWCSWEVHHCWWNTS